MSPSGSGLLKQALGSVGQKERVVGFFDCLACGPIDPPTPESRLRWMVNELGYSRSEWEWLPRTVNDFWRRATESVPRRIVWTSSRSANQHAAFLAWIEHMGDQQYDVVDLADIEVGKRTTDGRQWRGKALSLGMLDPRTIVEEKLWEMARPLEPSERACHLEAWRRLRAENAPLRAVGPNGLTSEPISYFDASLLSQASDQWQRVAILIGGVLAEGDGSYFQVGDHFLAARLAHLIATGQLDARLPEHGLDGERSYKFALTSLPTSTQVRLPQP